MKAKNVAVFTLLFSVLSLGTIFSQDSVPPATAMDYLVEGSRYYSKHDVKNAIEPYRKALELEKAKPTLPKLYWYVLVDNLGMSYGITGDLKKARETFEYGLSKDDQYPMFYYNLACTYAEMDDLDNTLKYLNQAFKYQQNVLIGEKMPDPAKDESFRRFIKNERFLDALTGLKSAGK